MRCVGAPRPFVVTAGDHPWASCGPWERVGGEHPWVDRWLGATQLWRPRAADPAGRPQPSALPSSAGGERETPQWRSTKWRQGKGKCARQKGLCILKGRERWERQSKETRGGGAGARRRGRAKALLSQKEAMETPVLRSQQSGQDEGCG